MGLDGQEPSMSYYELSNPYAGESHAATRLLVGTMCIFAVLIALILVFDL